MGLLDVDPNLFFLPPTRRGLRGHPYKVLQGTSHRRRRGSAYSLRIVKYWKRLPASVFTAPSGESLNRRLSPLPLLTEHSCPQSSTPLRLACTPPASRYVTQLPVLSMWFLQASCGLLFAITNHNQTSIIPMCATHLYILYQVRGAGRLFFWYINSVSGKQSIKPWGTATFTLYT